MNTESSFASNYINFDQDQNRHWNLKEFTSTPNCTLNIQKQEEKLVELILNGKINEVKEEVRVLHAQKSVFLNAEDYSAWKLQTIKKLKNLKPHHLVPHRSFFGCLLICFQELKHEFKDELACKYECLIRNPLSSCEDWFQFADECSQNEFYLEAVVACEKAIWKAKELAKRKEKSQLKVALYSMKATNLTKAGKEAEAMAAQAVCKHYQDKVINYTTKTKGKRLSMADRKSEQMLLERRRKRLCGGLQSTNSF